MRNAKIVCTLGPASSSLRAVEDLVTAGMAAARVNASHSDTKAIRELLETVREVDERVPVPVATILDLQGPEIRTVESGAPTTLESGDTVRFVPAVASEPGRIGLSRSIAAVTPGERILLDDGQLACRVTAVEEETVVATVETGGSLGARKGVNVPGVDLGLEMVTEKDRQDLTLAAEGLVDFVAASFVRDAEDVYEINAALEALDADVPIIGKIERAGAVTNMDEIIEASYGVMVARGDLGVECPMEDVPMIQKRLIRRSHTAGVPVITATEMLDSMVTSRRPTRAEASDVANAVLDGTDAVMLSGETAVGNDPTHVVETMDRIIREVEASEEYDELREQRVPPASDSRTDALARSGRYLARDLGATAVIAASETGYTALRAAKYRPGVPIIAVTLSEAVGRQLAISWGLRPHVADSSESTVSAVVDDALTEAIDANIVEGGDRVVVVAGLMRDIEGAEFENTLKVHLAAEALTTGRSVEPGRVSGPVSFSVDGRLDGIPAEAILVLPQSFEAEFTGNIDRIGGIVAAEPGLTGYPAMIARELDIPMISGASLEPDAIDEGARVTLDAERGVLYAGDIRGQENRDRTG